MTIKTISVENVRGIANQTFNLDIIPNKPSLLVAPNGFGKSSLAAAFASLNANRIALPSEHLHQGDETKKPKLTLTVERNGTAQILTADESSNAISCQFDVHVINNRLVAKATKRRMGGFTAVSATIEIDTITLIGRVPAKALFGYGIGQMRTSFGRNGKILRNIGELLNNPGFAEALLSFQSPMDRFAGVRVQGRITGAIERINQETGTADELRQWAATNVQADLESVECLRVIGDGLSCVDPGLARIDVLLNAYQICTLYTNDKAQFKSVCRYNSYLNDKQSYERIIRSFDTTWKNIHPVERDGALVVEFPPALHISSGQRDSLSFAARLQKINSSLGVRDCILVIDEVFDYLDDANLVAVQYYVSNLVSDIKSAGRRIYPLILTHLNPLYFRNFAFKDQKVYFLKKSRPALNEHFKKLIVKRGDPSISAKVDRHYLHYDPSPVNIRNEFRSLGLKETWGESERFHAQTLAEWRKYATNNDDYDPFAVCCYVRVRIEELIYSRLRDANQRTQFLNANGTTSKLQFAESLGIDVPDAMFLLGLIYNEGMHIKEHVDNSSPIVAKLENLTIRKMLIESTAG